MKKSLFIHIFILTAFLLNVWGPMPSVQADDFHLPAPGVMVHLSPPFDPPILKGIKVHSDNPFRFDFILDQGDAMPTRGHVQTRTTKNVSPSTLPNETALNARAPQRNDPNALKQEATKLIKYFLASLTIPEKDLWVNLSPYEKDRIIPQSFGLTEMGRDLLAEDYMLKQVTASLIYPEGETGRKFWKRVYAQATKKFGTTNIPVNTFNKVWIVPEKAVVYENVKAGTAYVVESKLKVMLEQDYLALEKNRSQPGDMFKPEQQRTCPQAGCQANQALNVKATEVNNGSTSENVSTLGSQIVREIVIPELTKEVNEGKNFAKLRQVYNSLILATWYKKKIKDSVFSQLYSDKAKVAGVNIDDPQEKERIYQKYLRAFKKGVFNYIKEERDPTTQEIIPRKYFTGGLELGLRDPAETGIGAPLEFVNTPPQQGNSQLVAIISTAEPFVGDLKDSAMAGSFNIRIKEFSYSSDDRHRAEIYRELLGMSQDIINDIKSDELVLMLRSISGDRSLTLSGLSKDVAISYVAEGSHKYVFKVEFSRNDGSNIQIKLAAKKEKKEGDITSYEINNLKKLAGRGVPRWGGTFVSRDGRRWFLEEFIEGKTLKQIQDEGNLTEDLKRRVITTLLTMATHLGGAVPRDINLENFIVKEKTGEVVMVDIGEKRLFILGRNDSMAKHQTIFLGILLAQYGARDIPEDNYFIFDTILKFPSLRKFQDGLFILKNIFGYVSLNGFPKIKDLFFKWNMLWVLGASIENQKPLDQFTDVFVKSLTSYMKDKANAQGGADNAQLPQGDQAMSAGGNGTWGLAMTTKEQGFEVINKFADAAYDMAWQRLQQLIRGGMSLEMQETLAPLRREILYRQDSCALVVSPFLQMLWRMKDFRDSHRVKNSSVDPKDFPKVKWHDFIVTFFNNDVWLIDPTYQQLVPPSKQDPHRKVLIVRLLDIFSEAEKLEIPGGEKIWVEGVKQNAELLGRINKIPGYENFGETAADEAMKAKVVPVGQLSKGEIPAEVRRLILATQGASSLKGRERLNDQDANDLISWLLSDQLLPDGELFKKLWHNITVQYTHVLRKNAQGWLRILASKWHISQEQLRGLIQWMNHHEIAIKDVSKDNLEGFFRTFVQNYQTYPNLRQTFSYNLPPKLDPDQKILLAQKNIERMAHLSSPDFVRNQVVLKSAVKGTNYFIAIQYGLAESTHGLYVALGIEQEGHDPLAGTFFRIGLDTQDDALRIVTMQYLKGPQEEIYADFHRQLGVSPPIALMYVVLKLVYQGHLRYEQNVFKMASLPFFDSLMGIRPEFIPAMNRADRMNIEGYYHHFDLRQATDYSLSQSAAHFEYIFIPHHERLLDKESQTMNKMMAAFDHLKPIRVKYQHDVDEENQRGNEEHRPVTVDLAMRAGGNGLHGEGLAGRNSEVASQARKSSTGGIDLTPANMHLQTKMPANPLDWRGLASSAGGDSRGIKFYLDPATLKQLQNAPGFVPVIVSIQPLKSLPEFLGLGPNQELAHVK